MTRLRADFSKAPHGLADHVILAQANRLWKQADRHGMRSQSDYTRYHYLLLGMSKHWHNSPDRDWITQILTRRDLTGTAKLDFIYQTLGATP